MYKDIGNKLKALAKLVFIIPSFFIVLITISTSISVGADLGDNGGLLVLSIGAVILLLNLILSWFLYGFGELIDKTAEIERHLNPNQKPTVQKVSNSTTPDTSVDCAKSFEERQAKLRSLRLQELITEDEFQMAFAQMQQEVSE